MDFRIEEKPRTRFVGIRKFIRGKDGKAMQRIRELWDESFLNGTYDKLLLVSDNNPGIAGLYLDYKKDGFTYCLAASSSKEAQPGMEEIIVEPGTFAVFEFIGPLPEIMESSWKRIYNEWFPDCEFEHADEPEIELYPTGDRSSAEYRFEIRIPVLQKKQRTPPLKSGPRGKLYGLLAGGLLGIVFGAGADNPIVFLLLGIIIGIVAGAAWDKRKAG